MSESTHSPEDVALSKDDRASITALFHAHADEYEVGVSELIPPDLFDLIEALVDAHVARSRAQVEEIDRNARAYGWEVGRGHPLTEQLNTVESANPFLDKNWREQIIRDER